MMERKLTGDCNQCPTCREYFNSTSAFDRHRIGEYGSTRRCMTVAEMYAAGMAKNSKGFWLTGVRSEKSIFSLTVGAKQPRSEVGWHYPMYLKKNGSNAMFAAKTTVT